MRGKDKRRTLRLVRVVTGLAWLYAAGFVLWFMLRWLFGDDLWWASLLCAFTPYFFLPLLLLLPVSPFLRSRAYWLALLPPVVLFMVLYGVLFLPRWPPSVARASETSPLRLLTFNIWGGSTEAATARVVSDYGADVVALQELSPV